METDRCHIIGVLRVPLYITSEFQKAFEAEIKKLEFIRAVDNRQIFVYDSKSPIPTAIVGFVSEIKLGGGESPYQYLEFCAISTESGRLIQTLDRCCVKLMVTPIIIGDWNTCEIIQLHGFAILPFYPVSYPLSIIGGNHHVLEETEETSAVDAET